MNALTISQGIFATALASSLAGFIACAALDLNAKQVRQNQTSLTRAHLAGWCSLYNWGMIFFAGVGLLAALWAMGERSPLPLTAPIDGASISFPTLLSVWLLMCAAGLATQRAFRVLRQPKTGVPFMRLMAVLIAASLSMSVVGCGTAGAPGSYVTAHDKLYKAKLPILNRYAAAHPDEAPAINDNIAAEGVLIENAKKGTFPQ